jgi:DNA end-binding protein Ku
MPRAIWSGPISFGLVNVPVKLYTAAASRDVAFHQLRESDGSRIQQRRFAVSDGEEVTTDELVKGYEVSPGRHVMITNEELESLRPKGTQGIEIEEFVDLTEIDPVYFEKSYYLVPDKGAAKPYALLRAAMQQANKVGLGRVVMRNKQYVAAIRPAGNALSLATLYLADEVVPQSALDELPDPETELSERELSMAEQLITMLSNHFAPEQYTDDYRKKLMELIEAKAAGEEVVFQPQEDQPTKVVDLMAALQASIDAAKANRAAEQKTG